MSKMGAFIAFQALILLLNEDGKEDLITQAYERAKSLMAEGKDHTENVVKHLYAQYDYRVVSDKISEILKPKNAKCEIKIIYQTLESLREACPHNSGDWFFSGDYPTPGGYRVVNRAFINFVEKKNERAY